MKHLEIRITASPLRHVRVGIIVPKYRHSAVERNRLKRQLRDIVRTQLLGTLPAIDVVIKAQPTSYRADYGTLMDELKKGAHAINAAVS
jgi:ribonuclease P protein component